MGVGKARRIGVTKRGLRAVVGVLVAAAVLGLPPAPSALADSVTDKKRSVDQQIGDLKDVLEGASQDLVDAAVQLKKSQLKLAQARAVLAQARAARAAAVKKDEDLAAQLAFAQAQLAKAQQEMDAERAAEQSTRAALSQLARETYVGNRMSGLSVALEATSPEEFSERMAVAAVALRAQGGAIDRLSVVEADLRARGAKLDAIRVQVAELKRQSAIVVAQRQAAEQAASKAEATVSALVADEARQLAVIQTKVAAEKQRLSSLEAEQAKLQAVLIARARAAAEAARRRHDHGGWNPPPSSGFLSYAAPGGITSGFGMRYHPILHIYRMHTGVDWGVPCGTPVHAAADGDIVSAGPAGGYGNRVVIDHGEVGGGDLATTYNHLSRIVVYDGSVSRGEVIGYSGTTGLSTGCHLHFETLLDGRFVNPMGYL
jgi:murein DD-endopeptidase MepM/ murein hydrolase activator NlpD